MTEKELQLEIAKEVSPGAWIDPPFINKQIAAEMKKDREKSLWLAGKILEIIGRSGVFTKNPR